MHSQSDAAAVEFAGTEIFAVLYNIPDGVDLNLHRFNQALGNMDPHMRCPTTGAVREHSYRVFCQVQWWLGIEVEVFEWGWIRDSFGLFPKAFQRCQAMLSFLHSY